MPFTSLDIPSHDTKAAKLRARSRSNSSAQREGSHHDTRHITLHTMKNYDMIHTHIYIHIYIYMCVCVYVY